MRCYLPSRPYKRKAERKTNYLSCITIIGNLRKFKPFNSSPVLFILNKNSHKSSLSRLFPLFLFIGRSVSVSDPPQVVLHLGSTLNAEDIKEGDDVYFECNIKANPKQHKITWYHNVSIVCFRILCPNDQM